jgi:hypothetical protein
VIATGCRHVFAFDNGDAQESWPVAKPKSAAPSTVNQTRTLGPALDRLLDFAAEVGLVVLIHNDIDTPFSKEGDPRWLTRSGRGDFSLDSVGTGSSRDW